MSTTAVLPNARTYKTSQMTYVKTTRTFAVEASSLRLPPGRTPDWIWLESAKTGEVRLFGRDGIDRTPDGEIAGWRYASRDIEAPIRVLIIND